MRQKVRNEKIVDVKILPESVLFFDMDGTLVDTNLANFLAYKKAITTVTQINHGISYNPFERFNRSNLKRVVPNLTESDYEKIIKVKEECFKDYLSDTKLNSTTVDILLKYSKTHKVVLVTNCRKDRVFTTLDHFGLTDQFHHIFYRKFSNNEEKINKFQNAITALNILPDKVIAFENEESEIDDARIAGIQIINPVSL